MEPDSRSDNKRVVYIFQGGGSLGSYQMGVCKALLENNYEPDWIIGTSIGAINASILAGNPPEKRMKRLHQFWDSVTQDPIPMQSQNNETTRRLFNFLSAERSVLFGDSHFFSPRLNNPLFAYDSTPDEISFYVVEPLKKLLVELIDFDLINRGDIRLTLSAVEVTHGKNVYFDTRNEAITLDHVMASSALPPGFPAVKINGKYYWDGGVINNAPITALLNEPTNVKTICFLAHVFDSFGLLPKNLDDVLKRHKDIVYSSHFRAHMEIYKIIHGLRYVFSQLSEKIPDEIKKDPNLQRIMHLGGKLKPIHFVRFLYEAPSYELSSKDYDFSRLSMRERCAAGYHDATCAIEKCPWNKTENEELGIAVHEFYQNIEKLNLIQKNS